MQKQHHCTVAAIWLDLLTSCLSKDGWFDTCANTSPRKLVPTDKHIKSLEFKWPLNAKKLFLILGSWKFLIFLKTIAIWAISQKVIISVFFFKVCNFSFKVNVNVTISCSGYFKNIFNGSKAFKLQKHSTASSGDALGFRISFIFASFGHIERVLLTCCLYWGNWRKLGDNFNPLNRPPNSPTPTPTKKKNPNTFAFIARDRYVFLHRGHVESVSVFSRCHLWGAHQPHYLRTSARGT